MYWSNFLEQSKMFFRFRIWARLVLPHTKNTKMFDRRAGEKSQKNLYQSFFFFLTPFFHNLVVWTNVGEKIGEESFFATSGLQFLLFWFCAKKSLKRLVGLLGKNALKSLTNKKWKKKVLSSTIHENYTRHDFRFIVAWTSIKTFFL